MEKLKTDSKSHADAVAAQFEYFELNFPDAVKSATGDVLGALIDTKADAISKDLEEAKRYIDRLDVLRPAEGEEIFKGFAKMK